MTLYISPILSVVGCGLRPVDRTNQSASEYQFFIQHVIPGHDPELISNFLDHRFFINLIAYKKYTHIPGFFVIIFLQPISTDVSIQYENLSLWISLLKSDGVLDCVLATDARAVLVRLFTGAHALDHNIPFAGSRLLSRRQASFPVLSVLLHGRFHYRDIQSADIQYHR